MKPTVCLCLLILTVLTTPFCPAANRYFVPPQTLIAGTSDQRIEIRCDNDVPVFGYSYGATYDTAVLSVTDLLTVGTIAETAFVAERIDAVAGTITCAAVLVLDPNSAFVDRAVPIGQNQLIGLLGVDVLATTDTVTTIAFAEVEFNPDIPAFRVNVMTAQSGSIIPILVDGEITIENRAPRITSVEGGSGLAGDVFQVVGEFFGEPGLAVRLCESNATFVLRSDGVTLDVTAPDCDQLGSAPLEVCTDRGCSALDSAFNYEAPPPPSITGISGNRGQEGTTFTVEGSDFDEADLVVRVCGQEAEIVSVDPEGTSIVASAPNCDALGPAEVEVCTALGCDADPEGFFYEFAGPRFTRGDCNGDGTVNGTSDTIFLLNFLFDLGPAWPCFAACDFNDDRFFDISDAVYLLAAVFAGGPALPAPAVCGPGSEGSLRFGCEQPQC